MTVPDIAPYAVYVGTTEGTVGPFPIANAGVPIPYEDVSHIVVTRTSASGVRTQLTRNVDYFISLNNVTLQSPQTPLLSTEFIELERRTPDSSVLNLTIGAQLSGATLQAADDRRALTGAELRALAGRAIRAPAGEGILSLPPASARAGKVLGFDLGTGAPIAVDFASGPEAISSVLTAIAKQPFSAANPFLRATGPSEFTTDTPAQARGALGVEPLVSISALRAASWTNRPSSVELITNHTAGDGGGIFRFDASDVTSVDNGGTLIVDANGGRWKRQWSGPVDVSWFTPGGSGIDCRVEWQSALDVAYAIGAALFVPARRQVYRVGQSGANSYCLLNEGVSILFEKSPTDFGATLAPTATVGSGVDIMRLRPRLNFSCDFWVFDHVRIHPSWDGTARGRRAIAGVFDQHMTVQNLLFSYCRCDGGADYSLHLDSNFAANPQGVPFAGKVIGGYYAEGTFIRGCADSFCYDETPLIRTISGDARWGIYLEPVNGAFGSPVKTNIGPVNIDCAGGAIKVRGSSGAELLGVNVEQSAGAVTAIVDIENCPGTIIDGLSIGVFGTATVTSCVRFTGTTNFPSIDNYKIVSAPTGGPFTAPVNGILVDTGVTDAFIGGGEIANTAGRITNGVADLGQGTRGILKAIALTSPFTNVGAGYAPLQAIKSRDGIVAITGWVQATTSASPQLICTLPVGFRPLAGQAVRAYDNANFGGSISPAVYDVFATGQLQVSGSIGAGRQFPVQISFPTQVFVSDFIS